MGGGVRSYVSGDRARTTFGWAIPTSPYSLGSSNEGIQATFNLAQYATLPSVVVPVWRLATAPTGYTLDSNGVLTKASSVTIGADQSIIVSLSEDTAGYNESFREFLHTVVETNRQPVFTGAPSAITLIRGSSYDFGQFASDPDGDTLTFTLASAPSNYQINSETGVVTLDNYPPVFTVVPTSPVTLPSTGGVLQFTAVDPDGDPVTYEMPQTREGVSVDPATGAVTVLNTAAGTTGKITVRAKDGTLFTDVSIDLEVTTTANTIRWNPGHYLATKAQPDAAHISTVISQVNSPTRPYIRGMVLRVDWATMEPSRGTYDFSVIDSTLAALNSDKYLFVHIQTVDFDASGVADYTVLPSYLSGSEFGVGGGLYFDPSPANDLMAKIWNQAVMDRKIALIQRLGVEYNTNPKFEGIIAGETATGLTETAEMTAAEYTPEKLVVQLERLIPAARAAMPNKNIVQYINAISPTNLASHFKRVLDACRTSDWIVGGPDSTYLDPTAGRKYINGTSGDFVYTGKIGIQVGDQFTGMIDATYTASGLINTAVSWGMNYGFWYYYPAGVLFDPLMTYIGANLNSSYVPTYPSEYPSATSGFKWTPGHYIKAQGNYTGDQNAYWTQVFSDLTKARALPAMRGAHVNIAWGAFNTSGSDYYWDKLDALFAEASLHGQQLICQINYKGFEADIGCLCPSDLNVVGNKYATPTAAAPSGWIMAVWRSAIMARFIAAVQAFATRYNSHPALELVTWSESSPGAEPTELGDYTRSAYSTQLQALMSAAAAAFTKTYVLCNVNSLVGEVTPLINNAFLTGGGFGTPDAIDTMGVKIFRGQTTDIGSETPPVYGDLRGRMAHHQIASAPVLGGKDNNGPPWNIINWSQTNKVTHLSWNTTVTTAGNTWADIQAAITADPLLHITRPTG